MFQTFVMIKKKKKKASVNNYMVMSCFKHVSIPIISSPRGGIAGQNVKKGVIGETKVQFEK